MKQNTTNYCALSIGASLFFTAILGFMTYGCHSTASTPPAATVPCVSSADAGNEASMAAPVSKGTELSASDYNEILEACTDDCVKETKEDAFCSCICSTVVSKIKSHHPRSLDDVLDMLPSVRPTEEQMLQCKKVNETKV